MYVYITEDINSISNFTNAQLIWKQEGLVYSDQIWYGGPNSDGTLTHSTRIRVSKVLKQEQIYFIYQNSILILPDKLFHLFMGWWDGLLLKLFSCISYYSYQYSKLFLLFLCYLSINSQKPLLNVCSLSNWCLSSISCSIFISNFM